MNSVDTRRTQLEGRTIAGRYELRARLANGGMGAVFRGWDHWLCRPVAVKMVPLSEEVDERQMRAREHWRWEAWVMAAASHPHVVNVYDAFVDGEDGAFSADGEVGAYGCVIMEMVEGVDLKRYVTQTGPLPCREALSIGMQVCQALHALHTRGFVHRDVKPHNILRASSGWVKLSDFGLAQHIRSDRVSEQVATELSYAGIIAAPGMLVGTAMYCSPEQAYGDQLTVASDIYSLGVVLYELLAGVPPFVGDTPLTLATLHAMASAPALHHSRPDIPVVVEQVVEQAMAKHPAERFASARAMGAALAYAYLTVSDSSLAPPMRTLAAVSSSARQMNAAIWECPTAPIALPAHRMDPADASHDGARRTRECGSAADTRPLVRSPASQAVSHRVLGYVTAALFVADAAVLVFLVMLFALVH